jgi:hypothetical protein
MNKASLSEKFALIDEHWRPKVIAQLNGQEVKLVKFQGCSLGIIMMMPTKCF